MTPRANLGSEVHQSTFQFLNQFSVMQRGFSAMNIPLLQGLSSPKDR